VVATLLHLAEVGARDALRIQISGSQGTRPFLELENTVHTVLLHDCMYVTFHRRLSTSPEVSYPAGRNIRSYSPHAGA
jgi:hypothetical protein